VILAAVVPIAIVLAGVGYLVFHASAGQPGTALPDLGNRHVDTLTTPHEPYNSDPPASGPHLPYIAPWGIYTRPIPPELQVHNLEDAGVLMQYNCDCPDVVAKLRAIVEKYPDHVILAPYPTMKSRIAVTAWTRIQTLNDVDQKAIVGFIDAYRGIDHHK
jgi:hypothetical protein